MKRRATLSIIGGVAILLTVGLVILVTGRLSPVAQRAVQAATYYCPMHPTYTSDRPGDCPICNMRLVKKEPDETSTQQTAHPGPPGSRAGAGSTQMSQEAAEQSSGSTGHASVLVTPQKRQLIGVKTAPVARRALTRTIRTIGRIAYDPQLYQAEAEYLQAMNAWLSAHVTSPPEILEQAKRLVESARMRLRLLGLSEELIDEMVGWPQPDARLLLADPSGQVWVYVTVYEYELPLVASGQTIAVEVPATPGKTFTGTVRAVDAVLDPMTRAARVRALITDPDRLLKPEMYVNASLSVPLGEVLAIPEDAVMQTGTQQVVFVDKGQGVFEPRPVTIGPGADGYHALVDGVAEGELVVTSGNFLIDSESRLKAALEGMSGSGGHQHGQ